MTTEASVPQSASPGRAAIVLAGCVLFGWALVATAWMSDDAFITLRTIDNIVNGYGPRWNVAERVQTYTHPAWLLLLTPFYAVTREPYYTALAVQMSLAMLTLLLVTAKVARSAGMAAVAVAVAVSSKAFLDYSTAGLENALVHILLTLIFLVWRAGTPRLSLLTLLISLAMLCRLELILLLLPIAIATIARRPQGVVTAIALGALPLVVWETFSLIYYGALVPNTALAKLSTGVPWSASVVQGLRYWWATFLFDPVTPIGVVTGAWFLAARFGRDGRLMAAGILLLSLFVVHAGGDFMSGRFLTPLLLWSVIGVVGLTPATSHRVPERAALTAAATILCGGLLVPAPAPLLSGARFGIPPETIDHFGVVDERRFYYPYTGLLPRLGYAGRPVDHPWEEAGRAARANAATRRVVQASNVGMFGYWAGPGVHIVDRNALGDAFLARLPARMPWRIGHFTRVVPDGYMETWQSGSNQIAEPDLRRFYDAISTITQGPIWRVERFALIARVTVRQLTPAAP